MQKAAYTLYDTRALKTEVIRRAFRSRPDARSIRLGHECWQGPESEVGRRLQGPGQERPQNSAPISTAVRKVSTARSERRVYTWEEGNGSEVQMRDALGRRPSASRRVGVERRVVKARSELLRARRRRVKLARQHRKLWMHRD